MSFRVLSLSGQHVATTLSFREAVATGFCVFNEKEFLIKENNKKAEKIDLNFIAFVKELDYKRRHIGRTIL